MLMFFLHIDKTKTIMRNTHFIGLNPNAVEWLNDNCVISPEIQCSLCGSVKKAAPVFYDTDIKIYGMFSEIIRNIRRYKLKDNRGYVEEYIQIQYWSSGPLIYLALKNCITKEIIPESLWTLHI